MAKNVSVMGAPPAKPSSTAPASSANLNKPESGSLVDLSFKVDPEFRRDFRLYAAEHELTQKEVLVRAFNLLKQQRA